MAQGKKIVLTERQEAWLVKHFKHTKNADVAAKLGISPRAVARFAARLGLKKTPQFMQKCQREMTDAAHRSHLRNGTYPPKGYKIPRREEYQLKPGECMKDRTTPKRWAERNRKAAESRAKTYKSEKARATFGLPQRTKLHVIPVPRAKVLLRHYLKRRGYIVDDVARVAYYDENTKRGKRIEAKPQPWYKFMQTEAAK